MWFCLEQYVQTTKAGLSIQIVGLYVLLLLIPRGFGLVTSMVFPSWPLIVELTFGVHLLMVSKLCSVISFFGLFYLFYFFFSFVLSMLTPSKLARVFGD